MLRGECVSPQASPPPPSSWERTLWTASGEPSSVRAAGNITLRWAEVGQKGLTAPPPPPRPRQDSGQLRGNHPGPQISSSRPNGYRCAPALSPQAAFLGVRAGREPAHHSPFLSALFLLLKRGRKERWDFPAEASATFLWLGWGGRALWLSLPAGRAVLAALLGMLSPRGFRMGSGSRELGAGTRILGAPTWMHCSSWKAFGPLSRSRMWICPYRSCPLPISWVMRGGGLGQALSRLPAATRHEGPQGVGPEAYMRRDGSDYTELGALCDRGWG